LDSDKAGLKLDISPRMTSEVLSHRPIFYYTLRTVSVQLQGLDVTSQQKFTVMYSR